MKNGKKANKPTKPFSIQPFKVEVVAISDLTPHPRNYRVHPEDQKAHIATSLKEHGVYRNVVVARDGTILAGHGVVEAARESGMTQIPVVRLPVDRDDPRALKVLTGDNEISKLAEVDDRTLTTILKEIMDKDNLVGTGFDDKMLAALVMVSRPESEIKDADEAAHWVGMPEHSMGDLPFFLTVQFRNKKARDEFVKRAKLDMETMRRFRDDRGWSVWQPPRQKEDLASLKFEEAKR